MAAVAPAPAPAAAPAAAPAPAPAAPAGELFQACHFLLLFSEKKLL